MLSGCLLSQAALRPPCHPWGVGSGSGRGLRRDNGVPGNQEMDKRQGEERERSWCRVHGGTQSLAGPS